ncbi:MAG TPA: DUF2071 domain-containing protein, partial [Longimicrobiaceae bacterium]|nr:DUF2071 domain-containing protein [Longimicrobiaceae bacterium]
SGEWIHYRSQRSDETRADFVGHYRPTGPIFEAERGSLAYFLAERYALFAVLSHGRVLCGNIHHLPWQLRSAEAEIERNTVTAAHGISLPDRSPLVHFTSRQDTLIWAPELAS